MIVILFMHIFCSGNLKKIQVPVSLSAEEFLDVLKNAFPRLGSADFDLAMVDCQHFFLEDLMFLHFHRLCWKPVEC